MSRYNKKGQNEKKGRDTPRGSWHNKTGVSKEMAEARAARPGTVRLGSRTSAVVLDLLRQLEAEKEARLRRLEQGDEPVPEGETAAQPEPDAEAGWKVGDAVDVESEDGWERGAVVLGPAEGGDANELRVRFRGRRRAPAHHSPAELSPEPTGALRGRGGGRLGHSRLSAAGFCGDPAASRGGRCGCGCRSGG